MLCTEGVTSSRPRLPIINVRTRPSLVQAIAFNFVKNLMNLEPGVTGLPTLDSINLPVDRQLIVPFGDLDSLCDSVVSAPLPRPTVAASMRSILN